MISVHQTTQVAYGVYSELFCSTNVVERSDDGSPHTEGTMAEGRTCSRTVIVFNTNFTKEGTLENSRKHRQHSQKHGKKGSG